MSLFHFKECPWLFWGFSWRLVGLLGFLCTIRFPECGPKFRFRMCLEDPNLLKLRSPDSSCTFCLSNKKVFGDNELKCSECYVPLRTSKCRNRFREETGETPLRFPAVFFEDLRFFLQKSAVFCSFLRVPNA